jgi:hypothetical protein
MPRSNNKPVASKAVVTKPVVTKPVVTKPDVSNSLLQNRISGNEQPSLFSSIKQGFGFGIGSSIAHNIFDSKAAKPLPPLPPVIDKITEFKECMEKTYSNYEECAPILK